MRDKSVPEDSILEISTARGILRTVFHGGTHDYHRHVHSPQKCQYQRVSRGTAEGNVTQNRVVLTDSGIIEAGKTVGKHLFIVTCFVPFSRTTDIVALMASVRAALRSVSSVRPTGTTTEGEILDDIKAYAVSMEYCAMCAL